MAGSRKAGRAALVPVTGAAMRSPAGFESRSMGEPRRGERSTAAAAFPGLDLSPVFVHSSFRTSSTWLWSKLRATPHATAYYEIFHEALGHLNVRDISGLNYSGWDSRHPAGAPYFLEFLPLLQESGGIPGFSPEMALDTFLPADGLDGELSGVARTYVARLIANAHANRKIPVLCCTRSLGRARALRKAFGGRTVFCHRNLFHQWASYAGQAMDGNPYFLNTVDLTLKASQHDPFLAAVDLWTAGRTISPTDEKLFQAFLMLHLYLSAHAFEDSDIRVDVTAMATSPVLRRKVEVELTRMVGAPVDLSDVRLSFDASPMAVRFPQDVVDTVTQFTKMISATCRTPQAGAFVEALKDAALAEWERHEFFVHKIRKVQAADLKRAERGTLEAAERARIASAERDALAAQAGAAAAEAAALRQERDLLQQAQSRHGEDVAAMVAAHAAAEAVLRAEIATLQERVDSAERARDAAAERMTALAADHAGQLARAHAAEAERDLIVADLQARVAAMTQEGERLAYRLGEVEAERDMHAHRERVADAERIAQSERAVAAEADRDQRLEHLKSAELATMDLSAALAEMTRQREALEQRLSRPRPWRLAASASRLRQFLG